MNQATENTPDADNLAGVLRRVQKLLAIAEDGRANADEAAAAAGMAERIMRKYQIEHADIIAAELARGGDESFANADVGARQDPEGHSKGTAAWSGSLAVAVAGLHDCQAKAIMTDKHGYTLRFQGYAADTQMARFCYIYLVGAMNAAARTFAREEDAGSADVAAFRRGFGFSLIVLLTDATNAKKAEMQAASSSRSLVLVKGQAVSDHFGVAQYRTGKRVRTRRGDAFREGVQAGKQVDVTRRALDGGSATQARIA